MMMMKIDRLLLLLLLLIKMLLMFEIYFIIMIFINIDIISNVKMLDLIRFITYRGDDIIDDVVLVDRDD